MKIFTSAKISSILLGLFLLFTLNACGVKTPPYPVESTLPGPIKELRQSLDENSKVTLSWDSPPNNMVKQPLKKLGGFEIEISENPAAEYCADCPHRYRKIDLLPALPPPPGLNLAPGPYHWQWQLKTGYVYSFRVAGVSPSGGVHPAAWVATTVWAGGSPGSLAGFSVGLADEAMEVRWNRPSANLQLELEKKGPDGTWQKVPELKSESGRYLDLAVEYEKDYSYRGRLVRREGESLNPGPWTAEVNIHFEDVVAPPPPAFVDVAQGADGRLRLKWQSQAETPDLALYHIYRRLEGETSFKRIGSSSQNAFEDKDLPKSVIRIYYQISAVDGSPRANESRKSAPVEIMYDPDTAPPVRPQN